MFVSEHSKILGGGHIQMLLSLSPRHNKIETALQRPRRETWHCNMPQYVGDAFLEAALMSA